MEQKLPPSGAGWDFPLLPAQALEQHLPLPEEGADGIPEDLQDVLLDGTDGAVPSLPADAAADGLFEELISGSVRLFDGVQPEVVAEEEMTKPAVCGAPAVPPVEEVLPQLPAVGGQPLLLPPAPAGYSLSPQPQQQVRREDRGETGDVGRGQRGWLRIDRTGTSTKRSGVLEDCETACGD